MDRKQMIKQNNKTRYIALRVAAIYGLFGFCWILLSDKLLAFLVRDPDLINLIQTFKGWLYVLITAALVYGLIDKYDRSTQKSQKRYRRLLANIADPIYLIDSDGNIIDANESATKTLGYDLEELLKLDLADINPDVDLDEWKKILSMHTLDKDFTIENRHKRKDGTIFPVEVVACIFEEDNQRYCLGVARDITQRRRTMEVMLQNEKLNSLGGMAAGIAHEINNPLSAILGACQNISNRIFRDTPKTCRPLRNAP